MAKVRNAGTEQDLGIQYKALKPEVDKLNMMAAKRQQVFYLSIHLSIYLFVHLLMSRYFSAGLWAGLTFATSRSRRRIAPETWISRVKRPRFRLVSGHRADYF